MVLNFEGSQEKLDDTYTSIDISFGVSSSKGIKGILKGMKCVMNLLGWQCIFRVWRLEKIWTSHNYKCLRNIQIVINTHKIK